MIDYEFERNGSSVFSIPDLKHCKPVSHRVLWYRTGSLLLDADGSTGASIRTEPVTGTLALACKLKFA